MSDEKKRRERGTGRIWQIGRIWWVQFYQHGRKIRESSGSDKESVAKKLLKRRLSEVELGVHRPTRRLRYEDIRDAFLADYVVKRRRSLRFDAAGQPRPLDKVKRLDSYFSGFRVEDIDSDSLAKFVAQLQKQGKQNGTINRSLSALRRMFSLAKKQGKLRDTPYFEMLPESQARSGFFEPAQYQALLNALPDYLQPVLTIAFSTAARSGEVRSIRWSQVDFLNDVIRLDAEQTKANTARQIPIFGELKKTLLAQYAKRRPDCEFVCFRITKAGHAVRIGDFRKIWQRTCATIGLGQFVQAIDRQGNPMFAPPRGPRSKAKPKMIYKGLLVHDLRRSGVRNLVRSGVSPNVARAISGHKTAEIFSRYDITSERDLKDAAQKLDTYLAKNGPSSGQISQENLQAQVLPN
jgi:integrase